MAVGLLLGCGLNLVVFALWFCVWVFSVVRVSMFDECYGVVLWLLLVC